MKSSFAAVFVVLCVLFAFLALVVFPGDAKVGVSTAPQVQLVAGDNHIGLPYLYAMPITQAMGSCFTVTTFLAGYYAEQSGNDTWRTWAPDMPPFIVDLWALEPGRGYTARLSEACLWTPGALTP